MAKTYKAGVKEYRETYWVPNIRCGKRDILAVFKITPQPGVPAKKPPLPWPPNPPPAPGPRCGPIS